MTYTNPIKEKIEHIFQLIPELFMKEKAKDVDGAYQVIFTDIDYPWHTIIEQARCITYPGIHPHPVVTMTISASDFADITYGNLNETVALMKGKLKLEGNLLQAVKYSKLFQKVKNDSVTKI